MESQHFVGNVAQKAIIEKDGTILVCRGIGDTVWQFPGGRLHAGESPHDGLIREVKEEFGIDITVIAPVAVIRSYHGKSASWQVFVAYRCTIPEDAAVVMDPAESEESQWVAPAQLKTLPMFDDCREVADIYLAHV